MDTVSQIVAAAASGSLGTLIVKGWVDRRTETRAIRRAFYVELLTLLTSRRRATRRLSYAPDSAPPTDLDEHLIDEFDAKLLIEASKEVRRLARDCLQTLHKFWNSYTMGAPIETDDHGFFHYEYEKVQDVGDQQRRIVMSMALGQLHDEFSTKVDAVADRIRRELHGRRP